MVHHLEFSAGHHIINAQEGQVTCKRGPKAAALFAEAILQIFRKELVHIGNRRVIEVAAKHNGVGAFGHVTCHCLCLLRPNGNCILVTPHDKPDVTPSFLVADLAFRSNLVGGLAQSV